jgi:hypothetical protein
MHEYGHLLYSTSYCGCLMHSVVRLAAQTLGLLVTCGGDLKDGAP